MNIDTDMQWAFWEGILNFYKKNEAYLQGQLVTPKALKNQTRNSTIPVWWLRKGQDNFVKGWKKHSTI